MKTSRWSTLTLGALAVAALSTATACSSSGGSGNGTSTGAANTTAASSSAGGSGSTNSSIAAAKTVVAPYIGHPGPFSVTEKLDRVPKGSTVAFMDCGLPYCAFFYGLLQQPAKMLGIHLDRINSGETAPSINTAFDSVVTKKPDAVIVMANQIQLWTRQLKKLQQDHIPVITQGVTDAEKYGIVSPQGGVNQDAALAKLESNYIAAEMDPKATIVYYEVPELSFTLATGSDFVSDLKTACPGCSVRLAKISASTIGKTSNNSIVSDLQAHGGTNIAVLSDPDLDAGLPNALKTAGLDVQIVDTAPGPVGLQQIKDGGEAVGLGADSTIAAWTLLDETAREIVGQKITGGEAEGVQVFQFLTKQDITFDPSKGWTAYPDFASKFAAIWGVPVSK